MKKKDYFQNSFQKTLNFGKENIFLKTASILDEF